PPAALAPGRAGLRARNPRQRRYPAVLHALNPPANLPRVRLVPRGRAVGPPVGFRHGVLRPAGPRLAGLYPDSAVCAGHRPVL
nr:hypothetical protein [Tanacetum cinerariifolium]